MRSNYIQTKRKKINSNKFQQQLIRVILVVGSIILLIIFFFGDHGLYQLYQLRTEKAKIQDAISSLRIKKQVLEEEKNKLNINMNAMFISTCAIGRKYSINTN
mgnify:CR=1 FL=1